MASTINESRVGVADAAALSDDAPLAASVEGVDLVVVKRQSSVAVFQGRCPHEGCCSRKASCKTAC